VWIRGGDGILLTTGAAALETDPEQGNWKGVVQTLSGTAVAGKALVVEIEIPGEGKGRAQLTPYGAPFGTPTDDVGEKATSAVVGLGRQPF
jgi:hypothetical protein